MLNQLYENVKIFNNLAGDNLTKQGFINQQKVLLEEVKEIDEGISNNDIVEILDGVVDTLYVALGQLYKLEQLGCDIEGAIKRVGEDNLTKFTSSEEIAAASVSFYNSKNVNVHWTRNDDYSRYVLKDENNKVKKPINFIPTDLSEFCPVELRKNGLK